MTPRLLLLLSFVASACGEGITEDPARTEEALANGHTYVGCSADERARLEAAWTRLEETPLARCLEDAVLVWTDGTSAARAGERFDDEPLVKVACVASTFCNGTATDAEACPGTGDVQVAVEREVIGLASTPMLAGMLAHARAHGLGFTHPAFGSTAYPHSIPRQAQRCAERAGDAPAAPSWLTRSELENETELSPIGSLDGYPFEFSCPPGAHARGFAVGADAQGLTGITIVCSDGSEGTFGDPWQNERGLCPPGDVLWGLGLTENDEGNVTKVGMHCVTPDSIRAGATDLDEIDALSEVLTAWPYYYGSGDIDAHALSLCPPEMVMRGVRGRVHEHVHRLSVVCERIDANPQGATHPLARAGSNTASFDTERNVCLGYGVMVGLWGRAGAEVDALGARCSPTASGPGGVLRTTAPASPREQHLLPSVGGGGGSAFSDNCPGYADGQVLIGLRVSAATRVHRVQGICADPAAWSNPSAPVTRAYTPNRGGGGGTLETLECPRGEVLVGTQAWAAKTPAHGTPTVVGVRPLCRSIGYCDGILTPQGACIRLPIPW